MNATRGFKRILLATDGSEQAQGAVDATVSLGRPASAEVRVVHVWNLDVRSVSHGLLHETELPVLVAERS